MPNRNPVKQLFITFPQSNKVTKHEFRDALMRFEPTYYKVCQEEHKDGSPHLHAVVKFKNKYSIPFVLKYFKSMYPDDYKRIHVKSVRSIKHALAYLSKEDDSPLESDAFIESRNPKKSIISALLKSFGYSSIEELQETLNEQREELKYWQAVANQYLLDCEEFGCEVPFHENKVIQKILNSENNIGKDDITFLRKYDKRR